MAAVDLEVLLRAYETHRATLVCQAMVAPTIYAADFADVFAVGVLKTLQLTHLLHRC